MSGVSRPASGYLVPSLFRANQWLPGVLSRVQGILFSDLQDQILEATNARLRFGHVLNIMPGLHIPADPIFPEKYHNIGVRIEDTVALTNDGAKILTDLVPREIHELEGILGLEI